MLFSLIHPSRGRCFEAMEAMQQWISKSSGIHEIEYLCSVDIDDPSLQCYIDNFDSDYLLINDNRSIVGAVNVGALDSKGDCLVVISDDFDCIDDWDMVLHQRINGKKDFAILIDDGIQKEIMTLPIISRELYNKIGFIYYPGYFSMFADNDITEVCKKHGTLIDATDLLFKHRHYTVEGGMKRDHIYDRENSKSAWVMGEKLFKKRKAANFNL